MILIKDLEIVPPGQVYPVKLLAGTECPVWAEAHAIILGRVDIGTTIEVNDITKRKTKALKPNLERK